LAILGVKRVRKQNNNKPMAEKHEDAPNDAANLTKDVNLKFSI